MLLLVSLAHAGCINPCDGAPGTLRLELAGGAMTVLGSATSLGNLIPPAFSNNQELGTTWVGLATLPLQAAGPLLLASAGGRYRSALRSTGQTPVSSPWLYAGWGVGGLALATSLTGIIQGWDEQKAGPILQLSAVPLFMFSAVAFELDNAALRHQAGNTMASGGITLAPLAWASQDSSGLGLSGSF